MSSSLLNGEIHRPPLIFPYKFALKPAAVGHLQKLWSVWLKDDYLYILLLIDARLCLSVSMTVVLKNCAGG